MSQNDLVIANQSFPSFRTDLNSALQAINTSQSGTSRPSGAVSGTIWLDTTSATSPTLKYYDGADDISLATLDHTGNTVNWLDSTVSVTGLTTTATGTVLTLSDSASTSTVNLIIDNQKEIRFRETTANGTNYIGLKAPASVTADLTFTLPVAPTVNNQALISTTAGVMAFTPYTFPTSDGTASQVLQTNGSGVLSFSSVGGDYVLLASTSASNVATLDLNGYFSATYKNYKLFVEGYYGTSDVNNLRLFFATGSYTVQTTSYGDISGWAGVDNGGTEASGTTAGGHAGGNGGSIFIGHNSSNSSYRGNTEITIFEPLQTSYYHHITALTQYWNGSTTLRSANTSGTWLNTTAVTGIRLAFNAGNLYAGSIKLYGIK
jgi:hypothetical protein